MDPVDRYRDLLIFVTIADRGGFGRAAAHLGISTSQVSRALAALEDRLGARLFNRTTRQVALTDAGRALHERARTLLAELDEAEAEVRDQSAEPRGTLRVSLPVHFGLRFLTPLAAEFATLHPNLRLELSFEDRRVDLVEEGFDLAVRISPMGDSSLIGRKLGATHILTVASPAYLERNPAPLHPRDLAQHHALLHDHESSWRFRCDGEDVSVRVAGRFAANNGEALRHAVVLGLGVARLPDFMVAPDVGAGRLVRLLASWEEQLPIVAVYPPGRHLSPKVRRWVDFLVLRLAEAPWSQCREAT
jgi:DNA-binding transcriptional LysR family regulator